MRVCNLGGSFSGARFVEEAIAKVHFLVSLRWKRLLGIVEVCVLVSLAIAFFLCFFF